MNSDQLNDRRSSYFSSYKNIWEASLNQHTDQRTKMRSRAEGRKSEFRAVCCCWRSPAKKKKTNQLKFLLSATHSKAQNHLIQVVSKFFRHGASDVLNSSVELARAREYKWEKEREKKKERMEIMLIETLWAGKWSEMKTKFSRQKPDT